MLSHFFYSLLLSLKMFSNIEHCRAASIFVSARYSRENACNNDLIFRVITPRFCLLELCVRVCVRMCVWGGGIGVQSHTY
jgi:hypothetical protein